MMGQGMASRAAGTLSQRAEYVPSVACPVHDRLPVGKEARGMSQKQQMKQAHHGHPLPRVRSASTYWMRGTAVVLAFCVVGLPLNAALGGKGTVSAVLATLLIISLVWVVIAASLERAAKKAIPRMLTDEQTVHWTYTSSEWQRFCTLSWQRSIRRHLKVTGITWGLLLVLALITFANANGTLNVAAVLALSMGVAVVVGVLLFGWAAVLWQWRRRQTTLEAYLSPGGFILCGWYAAVNWTVGGRRKITYTAGDPGVLFFDVGTGRGARVLEVPVPAGHEAEAQHLTLSMRFPRA